MRRLLSLALLIPIVFAACDSNKSTGIVGRDSVADVPPNPPGANSIMAENFRFRPASLTITAGQTVTWSNGSSNPHDVTSDNGAFTSGSLAAAQPGALGGAFSFTFTQAGTFAYHCALHPQMTGTITVQ